MASLTLAVDLAQGNIVERKHVAHVGNKACRRTPGDDFKPVGVDA